MTNGVINAKTNAKCLSGFTNTTSFVTSTNVYRSLSWNCDWTFVTWIRNPDMSSSIAHIIARGGSQKNAEKLDGAGSDNSWQVWITPEGAIGLALQMANGKQIDNSAEGAVKKQLEWKEDTWYQIAVLFEYDFSNNVYTKSIKAYVTEEGATSLGEPAASITTTVGTGLLWHEYLGLTLGAARKGYYSSFCEGYLKGEMREATLFKRLLTMDELLYDVQTFSVPYYETKDFAKFYWQLDEMGKCPTAADATGNGFTGTTAGNVEGGLEAPTGTCYGGFTSMSSSLYTTLDGDYRGDNDVVMWVKRPEAKAGSTAMLAGNMNGYAEGKSQPWRVFVTETGAVGVSMQSSYKAKLITSVGDPYNWGKGWHLVLIRIGRATLTVKDTTKTASCSQIRVYIAPAVKESEEGAFTLVAQAALQEAENTNIAAGKQIVFGAAPKGYYGDNFPASYLGSKGRIGEVAMSVNSRFEMDYLKTKLSAYYSPESGFMVLVK